MSEPRAASAFVQSLTGRYPVIAEIAWEHVVVASVARTGQGMALFGLLLGAGCFVTTRSGSRRSPRPFSRGQDWAAKLMAVPLLVIGLIGLVLWAVGTFRG